MSVYTSSEGELWLLQTQLIIENENLKKVQSYEESNWNTHEGLNSPLEGVDSI